ncbi:MAG: ATP-binding protein [Merdibacter sp.]
MALLDLCRRSDLQLHCAHVNYHHRDSADRDQHLCERYCAQWSIPIHILHAHRKTETFRQMPAGSAMRSTGSSAIAATVTGARCASADDVLETYLMQKQRGSIPSFYGLRKKARSSVYVSSVPARLYAQ